MDELETLCEKCKGEQGHRGYYGYEKCHGCDGAGFVPSELGEKILRLIRHNVVTDNDAIKIKVRNSD